MRSYVSLDGMLSYLENINTPLFSAVSLPTGIDRQTMIDTIYQDGAEFGVIYPDPTFFRNRVNAWFLTKYKTFDKWNTVLNMEYNPIENYDRMEAWTDSGTISDTGARTDTGTSHDTTESTTTLNGSTTTENETSGTESGTTSGTTSETEEGSETRHDVTDFESESNGRTTLESHTTGSRESDGEHEGRIHGNIGVTTTQAMIEQELSLRKNYNIYNMISDCFCDEFLIQVY